ncbi:MAG: non-homologous end-joining DNA ligase, partial [Archaeoglobaceae archaeon]|nr:non-homologous end-joining DNA ligase [Archaeoglobaceae archaeon]MDW8128477.1 non-homologous end-joining DNA ligase [Archaeoglobaceae archaeon]
MSWFEERIRPMLAVRGKPFSSPNYFFEIKWDGTRAIAFVDLDREKIRIQNRRMVEIAHRYPEFDLLDFVSENAILDGEIVVFEGNKPSFNLLQKREHVESKFKASILSKKYPANYLVFDVLYTESLGWLLKNPLEIRKRILSEICSESKRIALVDYIEREGEELYERATRAGIEGVVGKRKDSLYLVGKRSDLWIKVKKRNTGDFVIVGWLEGEGERSGTFGSLILALLSEKGYVHVGQVGTGFDSDFLEWFSKKLKEIEINEPYFKIEARRAVHWTKAVYVCEVEFLELTPDLKL